MYDFHYDYLKNKYDNKSRLLLTDTDILMYEIKTEDVYKDFSKDKKMFDFSNYSAKSKYYVDSNKSFFCKMKDKIGSVAIKEVFGIKPKIYSFLVNDNTEHRKAEGVNKNVAVTIRHGG